jgi:predicted transglutaminase-like cysteine proteinase
MTGPSAFRAALLAAGSILLGLAVRAVAQTPPPDTTTPVGRAARPPAGYLALCERDPAECRASRADPATDDEIRKEATAIYWTEAFGPGAAPASAPPTPDPNAPQPAGLSETGELIMAPQVWALMYRVNGLVNREIRMESDQRQYDEVDYWNVAAGEDEHGDCEDYVLTKRRLLIDAGIPPRVLSFGIVRTSWGELHAILIVKSDQGDLILDNIVSDILHWDNTGYHWIKRQMPGDPFDWRRVTE